MAFDVPVFNYGTNGPVTLWYDQALASNSRALASLDATLPALKQNYDDVQALFGNVPGAAPCNVIITATGADNTFQGKTDGTGGAYHYATNPGDFPQDPGWDMYVDLACDAVGSSAALIHSWLFIAELVESFEVLQVIASPQGFSWGAGWSNGEALSRFIAEVLVGGLAGPIQPFTHLFETGKFWYNAGKPDWINQTDDTDTDPISTGCGVVYMWWLMVTKGISPADICQATCDPNGHLSDHYNTLRAKYPSRFPVTGLNPYGDLVTNVGYIGNPPPKPITTDNPWRVVTYPSCSGCCTPIICCGACSNQLSPTRWTVTLSGFGNSGIWGSLGALSCLNGSWVLTKNQFSSIGGQTCTWELNQGPPQGRMGPLIILVGEVPPTSPSLSNWYLTVGSYGTISNVLEFSHQWQYSSAGTPKECTSPITFSNPICESSTTDGDCSGTKPATITVTPILSDFAPGCDKINCGGPCRLPTAFQLAFTGFTDNECNGCANLNQTFVTTNFTGIGGCQWYTDWITWSQNCSLQVTWVFGVGFNNTTGQYTFSIVGSTKAGSQIAYAGFLQATKTQSWDCSSPITISGVLPSAWYCTGTFTCVATPI
jgi:hypothetical protein